MSNDIKEYPGGNDERFVNTSDLSERDRPFKRRGIDPRFKSRDRWELERERFQLEDAFPPAVMSDPVRIGDKLEDVLKILKVDYNAVQDGIASNWHNIARADYAAQSKPGSFDETTGTLVIYVQNMVWLNQIRRMAQHNLLERIQASYPQVKKLVFRLQTNK